MVTTQRESRGGRGNVHATARALRIADRALPAYLLFLSLTIAGGGLATLSDINTDS